MIRIEVYDTICYCDYITIKRGIMEARIIRIRLTEELFRKYKVLCAINDLSMTQQTENIVRNFIKEQGEVIKIINTKDAK